MARKQPEDPEVSISGNARQRRRIVRKWKAAGYRVRYYGGEGQLLLDKLKTPNGSVEPRQSARTRG